MQRAVLLICERRSTMPVYVMLMNLTQEGAKGIKDQPEKIRESIQQGEAMGGKPLGFYLTMGEYD
jgi:uncharacterized protein with GYD domain